MMAFLCPYFSSKTYTTKAFYKIVSRREFSLWAILFLSFCLFFILVRYPRPLEKVSNFFSEIQYRQGFMFFLHLPIE